LSNISGLEKRSSNVILKFLIPEKQPKPPETTILPGVRCLLAQGMMASLVKASTWLNFLRVVGNDGNRFTLIEAGQHQGVGKRGGGTDDSADDELLRNQDGVDKGIASLL